MTFPQTTLPMDAIKAMVMALSGGISTSWATEPRNKTGMSIDPEARAADIDLSLQSYRSKGVDEYRQLYDAAADIIRTNLVGYRLFTVTVRARSMIPSRQPHDILESVRWRLRSYSGLNALIAANLALVDVGSVMTIASRANDRAMLTAVMDVHLAMLVQGDPLDDDGQLLATVNGDDSVPGTLT